MLDRASTFADPEIVKLLQTRFVPVALDQAYQRRQKDAEGDFYRRIAGQSPRNDFKGTTQGFYAASPAGDLLFYNNNRDQEKVQRLLEKALAGYKPPETAAIENGKPDPQWNPVLPAGGLVVRVRAKVLGGYEETDNRFKQIFQSAVSRDNLWISPADQQALVEGKLPDSLLQRMARFHLVDNTRGEPPMWKENEVRKVDVRLDKGKLQGTAHLETASGERGYQADLLGTVETKEGKVTRFDVAVKGEFWGEGQFTRNAPKGKFPLAITFTLADGTDMADRVPPQAARGWLAGYLR